MPTKKTDDTKRVDENTRAEPGTQPEPIPNADPDAVSPRTTDLPVGSNVVQNPDPETDSTGFEMDLRSLVGQHVNAGANPEFVENMLRRWADENLRREPRADDPDQDDGPRPLDEKR